MNINTFLQDIFEKKTMTSFCLSVEQDRDKYF